MIFYKSGDGSTKEKAIFVLGASNETEGIDAEYHWLEEKYSKQNIDWELVDQQLIDEGDKQYDILRIKFRSGDVKEFWFDITSFYGK